MLSSLEASFTPLNSLNLAENPRQVHTLSTDFRAATRIISERLPRQLPPGHVLVRRAYAGVNASDVNYTAGRYFGGGAAARERLPFDAGFESVGVVAALGPGVSGQMRSVAPCALGN